MRWAEAERLAPTIHARWMRVMEARNREFGSGGRSGGTPPTWDELDQYRRVQITAWVIAAAEHFAALECPPAAHDAPSC
jgi:hypothetical protein